MALKDFLPQQYRCSSCANCRFIPFDKVQSSRFSENCPSICYHNFATYAARGRYQIAKAIVEERQTYTDAIVDVVHTCTACGACDVACKVCRYNLDVLDHNLELKADAVEKGHILPRQKVIMDSLKNEQTMMPGMKKANRADWAKGIKVKDLSKEKGEVAFFAGCKYSYEPELQKIARADLELLLKCGVDVGLLGALDNCCAGRAHQMGFFADFKDRAEKNIKAFETAGVKTIVTPCSDCYHSFKRLYAELGMNIEVLHVVEYLDKLIKDGTIKFTKTVPMTVTYHDPCHLGRLGEPYIPWNGTDKKILGQVHVYEPKKPRYSGAYGIYDAPRDVLKSIPGIKLVEMERIREYSWCCGAGGGVSETKPEYSEWTASERVTEANATGADALVTACPWCEANFSGVAGEDGKKIKVYDIAELVLQAL
jgi:Fe-S oxidoreductase